jgi:hypothetical protein
MSSLAHHLATEDAINALLASPSPRWENGVLVWRYPMGIAENAFYFRNRGHDLQLDPEYLRFYSESAAEQDAA